ncbi:helix-turn-helix transcriptional regulator [Saccharospirillum salsuginis]|uniref:WYL domain-containing protein n=1 Tax=Saccharospirillum salsuginis TaxID=418750 RepID=A0A918NAN7_9GAMM|nr:WYL domain-containing protein [Saccharospirillum salsuginis]GGX56688.1 WYL domain-containing protein [Saccharospirillum salsuginis]
MATDTWIRYWFIELHAWWEGRINTTLLTREFAISRQHASKLLGQYQEEYPGNLVYSRSAKAYRPTDQMTLSLISGDVAEYFNWVSEHRHPTALNSGFATLDPPRRNVAPTVLRPMTQALRERRRLEVDYVSLTNPDREGRIIVPHTFVNTGLRWHLRAWCEKSQEYRDFVLSRFRGEPELLDTSPHGIEDDQAWNTRVTLQFEADSRLPADKRAVIEQDYQMENGQLAVTTRAALVHYVLQEMQVNTKMIDASPLAQQLILVNRDDIKPWLFDG